MLNAALTRGLAKLAYRELASAQEVGRERAEGELERSIEGYRKGFAEGHERLRAIEAEARRLARDRIEAALYRYGKALKDLAAGEQQELIAREAETSSVLAEATRRIDTLRAIGAGGLEELSSDQ